MLPKQSMHIQTFCENNITELQVDDLFFKVVVFEIAGLFLDLQ